MLPGPIAPSRDPRLWALALPLSLAAIFHETQHGVVLFGPAGALVAGAAALLLLRPESASRLYALLALLVVEATLSAPWIFDHQAFLAIVSAGLLATAGGRALRGRLSSDAARREDPALTLDTARRAVGCALPILYAWACFHKLNASFLDPRTSVGVTCYMALVKNLSPFPLPQGEWARTAAIYGTLAAEAGLPLLLCVKRTRVLGALLAMLFHVVLGLADFEDFSAIVFAMLPLYLPDAVLDEARSRVSSALRRVPLRSPGAIRALEAATLLAAAATLLVVPWRALPLEVILQFEPWAQGPTPLSRAAYAGFAVYGPTALALLAASLRSASSRAPPCVRPGFPCGALVVLALALNGSGPYWGLKTESAFAMLSGLRTEGGRSNHLLFRRAWPLLGYQEDLVRIRRSGDEKLAALARGDLLVPWFELRSYVSRMTALGAGGFPLVYERGSVLRSLARASDEPELTRPDGWFERKLVGFEPVSRAHTRPAR